MNDRSYLNFIDLPDGWYLLPGDCRPDDPERRHSALYGNSAYVTGRWFYYAWVLNKEVVQVWPESDLIEDVESNKWAHTQSPGIVVSASEHWGIHPADLLKLKYGDEWKDLLVVKL